MSPRHEETALQRPATITREDGVERYPMRYAGKVRLVPLGEVEGAIAGGYQEISQREVDRELAAKEYKERVSGLQRGVTAGVLGASQTVLGIPALAANLLPGVEGLQGGDLMAKLLSSVTYGTEEEIADELRMIAKDSPKSDFTGKLLGAALGTKGIGVAGTAAAKVAPVVAGARTLKVASVAESALGHVIFANETAFVDNRELTAEMAAMSVLAGVAGPIGLQVIKKGVTAPLRAVAAKIDVSRLDKFQKAMPVAKAQAPGAGFPKAQAPPIAKGPAKLTDLFGSSTERLRAASGLLDEMAGKSAGVAKGLEKGVKYAGRYGGRRAVGAARRAAGWKGDMNSLPGMAAMMGGFMADHFGGVIIGGVAGKLVQRFGPKVAGPAFNNAATHLRSLSQKAATAASSGAKKTSAPREVVKSVGRQVYRARLSLMMQDVDEYTSTVLNNPTAFTADIGAAYGGLSEADSSIVGAITQQHMRSAAYLKENEPATHPRSLVNAAAGRTQPPIEEMEKYARKVRAVQNPLVILNDLQQGALSVDTVDAVKAVYPSMYLDMQTEVLKIISDPVRPPLTNKEEKNFDTFFGSRGAVYAAYRPAYQGRLNVLNKEILAKQQQNQPAPNRQGQGGGSNPSLSQSMRTTSQRLMSSGNG